MRTRLRLLLSVAALFAACSAATAKDAVVMRIVHTAPLDHQITLALHAFALDVEERTKGDVVVDVITKPRNSDPPISPPHFIEAVAKGTVEAACMPNFLWTRDIPQLDFSMVPFLYTGLGQMRAFPDSQAAQTIEKEINRHGVKTLAWLDVTRLTLMTSSNSPIVVPADFRSRHVRVLDEFSKRPFEQLGATPMVLEASEVHGAIEAGKLDSVMTDISSAIGLKLYEVQKYATVTPYFSAFYHLYVNPAWLARLSPTDRAAVEAAGKQLEKTAVTITEAKAAASLDILRTAGVAVHVQTPEERRQWQDAMQGPALVAFKSLSPAAASIVSQLPAGKP